MIYTKAKCPKCGEEMQDEVLTVYPPISIARCTRCGFSKKLDTDDVQEKPLMGVTPYYAFYSQRIRDLANAISRHAGNAEDHCVHDWIQEILILRALLRTMRTKEFYEEEMEKE